MRKRDTNMLTIGDRIRCKHNLGEGTVIAIAHQPRDDIREGRFPMIQFTNDVTCIKMWVTYRIIDDVTHCQKALGIVR